jgi:chromate transporter
MIKHELVALERWITPEKFNRVYAVYQLLPGPEAHELCVYFGTLARGRLGGLLAGLGFMLPGFLLMLGLSWVYVRFGIASPSFNAAFTGVQAAVLALIVRAVHRIGKHALVDRSLWAIAIGAAVASLVGVHFALTLLTAGLCSQVVVGRKWVVAGVVVLLVAIALLAVGGRETETAITPDRSPESPSPGLGALFGSGLRSGLLTFGGAYTVIPFLLNDSVEVGGWITREQFLDGVALGGILPAPLIIFATFVGYIAGGLLGALALTVGIFLPAFGFTMLGHEYLERVIHHAALQRFLLGVTAGVVGLIAATAVSLVPTCIEGVRSFLIFAAALSILYRWHVKWSIAVVIALGGAAGWVLF